MFARAVSGMVRPLAVALVLMAAASGCSSGEHRTSGTAYVALGDSYTAGPGIAPVADTGCGRSAVNYPSLVAKALKITKFTDRSCSGARTANLEQEEIFQSARVNGPQLSGLGAGTTLVTVGMGMNNHAIATGLLLLCTNNRAAGAADIPSPSPTCQQYLDLPEAAVDEVIQQAADELKSSLETIHRKAPRARIVLVGYPRIAPDQGRCTDRLPVPDAQLTRLRSALEFADGAWRDVAKQVGATYIDTYALSKGHDVCSDAPWINGAQEAVGKAAALHPFEAYHRAVAAAIVKALGRD